MSENLCLSENNSDLTKVIENMLEEKANEGHAKPAEQEGPLSEKNSHCDKCNFKSKNRVLLNEHKSRHANDEEEHEEDEEELGFWDARTEQLNSNSRSCSKCDYIASKPIHMKSHMLIKHKEAYIECTPCQKMFKTSNELQDHTRNGHNANSNLLLCTFCNAKFVAAHSLKQHTEALHKDVQKLPVGHAQLANRPNLTQITRFKCRQCGNGHSSGIELDEHLKQCHEKQTCTFFTEGRCTRGQWCQYSHETKPKRTNNQECTTGPQCIFLAQMRCNFFHPGKFNQTRPNKTNQRNTRPNNQGWRGHQAAGQQWVPACTRGGQCRFLAAGNCHFFHEDFLNFRGNQWRN